MDKIINLEGKNAWSPEAIKALMERLYEVKRRCQGIGIQQPVFVLPCNNEEQRWQFEDAIYRYFYQLYGKDKMYQVKNSASDPKHMIVQFSMGVTVVLMEC